MTHSLKNKDEKNEVTMEASRLQQKPPDRPEIFKFNPLKIEEKIMDSLNSLKYGF